MFERLDAVASVIGLLIAARAAVDIRNTIRSTTEYDAYIRFDRSSVARGAMVRLVLMVGMVMPCASDYVVKS